MAFSTASKLQCKHSALPTPAASCAQPKACRVVKGSHARCVVARAEKEEPEKKGFFANFFTDFFDPRGWAPRSAKAWRLNQYDYETNTQSDEEAELVSEMEACVSRMSQQAGGSSVEPFKSFSDAEDGKLASALQSRLKQMTAAVPTGEVAEAQVGEKQMTGEELRSLVYKKYGKTHDISMVRRDIPGKTFVLLNVMWGYLEARSFRMTEEQYMEKLDSIAYLLNAVDQADSVRSQLSGPARSSNGMPARPVPGTAISLKLDVSQSVVKEWFGQGYQ
eukprot:gene2224-33786_t